METRTFDITRVDVDERAADGGDDEVRIVGYAARYNAEYRLFGDLFERISRGAFKTSLQTIKDEGRRLKMFFNHNRDAVVGIWDQAKSRNEGLQVEGTVKMGITGLGDEAARQLSAGLVDSLSIGYRSLEDDYEERADGSLLRTVRQAELVEVSVVTLAASPTSMIVEVRNSLGLDDDADVEAEFRRRAGAGGSVPGNGGTALSDPYEVLRRYMSYE